MLIVQGRGPGSVVPGVDEIGVVWGFDRLRESPQQWPTEAIYLFPAIHVSFVSPSNMLPLDTMAGSRWPMGAFIMLVVSHEIPYTGGSSGRYEY